MKSIMVNKFKNELDIRVISGKKVELYNFYELCGFYKRIKAGEEIKYSIMLNNLIKYGEL